VKVNKKVVKLALKSLLSDRVSSQRFIVVDKIELADFKTKSLLRVVKDLNLEGKIIFVSPEYDFNLFTAGRNIPNVLVQTKNHLSVYQLTDADYYVMPLEVVKKYEEELA
jgi:large subunit ribosomal protein L4